MFLGSNPILNLRFLKSTVFNPIFNPSFLPLGSTPIQSFILGLLSQQYSIQTLILVSLQAMFTIVRNHLKFIKSTLTLLLIVPDIGPVQTLILV